MRDGGFHKAQFLAYVYCLTSKALLKTEEVLKEAAAFTMHLLFKWPKKPPACIFFEAALLPSCDQVTVADNLFFSAFKENNI